MCICRATGASSRRDRRSGGSISLPAPGAGGHGRDRRAARPRRADGYRLRLVDHPHSYDRAGFYGEGGSDYPDNGARFALLGRAALEAIRSEGGGVAVLHGHDWQAGPAVLLRDHRYAADPLLAGMATMLTCHNLAYHGWVPRERAARRWTFPPTSARRTASTCSGRRWPRADIVNTVSPTYAEESRTPEYGAGLDDLLQRPGEPLPRDPQRDRPSPVGPRDRRGTAPALLGAGPGREGRLQGRPRCARSRSTRPTRMTAGVTGARRSSAWSAGSTRRRGSTCSPAPPRRC